jgi:hypothetical protein
MLLSVGVPGAYTEANAPTMASNAGVSPPKPLERMAIPG